MHVHDPNALCTCYALVHVTLILAGANIVSFPDPMPTMYQGWGLGTRLDCVYTRIIYTSCPTSMYVQCILFRCSNFKSYADAVPLNLSYACVAHSWQFQLSKNSDENPCTVSYEWSCQRKAMYVIHTFILSI